MGSRGPVPKSAELRVLEGERAHRPLPSGGVRYVPGAPERPKGMSAAARRIWDGYVDQLAPLGVLRSVDGFALRRLCEDVAMLEELQAGQRKLAQQMTREAKAEGRKLPGGAMIDLAMSHEGRRLSATINTLASRIKRDEMQFGLTPVASQRLENIVVPITPQAAGSSMMDPVEAALCG
jgi:phage terminase small subunit